MKKVGITIGDPGGIGPEVVVKSLPPVSQECLPIVIGDFSVMEEAVNAFSPSLRIKIIDNADDAAASPETLWLISLDSLKAFKKGSPDAENAIACVNYIKKAVSLALGEKIDAIVTAPISKEALKMAGMKWPGHTEMLAELTAAKDYAMMFYSDRLKIMLVTIHTALKDVPKLITKENVFKKVVLAKKACDMLDIENPRIGVAGINPHAGESGIFGDEEIREIAPAIAEAQNMGIPVSGPYPADVIFRKAYRGEFDIIVCMYHDQGLAPFKMIAFDKGVNMTVGLPIIRTSPDHGTAYDIAWKGIADPSSMIEAIKLAARLTMR